MQDRAPQRPRKPGVRWHAKHPANPFTDAHLAPLPTRMAGHKWPQQIDHTALSDAVMQWLAHHEELELPTYMVQAVMRYTFAGVRYFVNRGHQVRIYKWGHFTTRRFAKRAWRNTRTGLRRWYPARISPLIKVHASWVEELTQRELGTSAFRKAEERKRAEWFLQEIYPEGSTLPLTFSLLESFGLHYQTFLAAARQLGRAITKADLIDDLTFWAVQPPPPTWKSRVQLDVEAELPQLEAELAVALENLKAGMADPELGYNERRARRSAYRRIASILAARKRLLVIEERERHERLNRKYTWERIKQIKAAQQAASQRSAPETSFLSAEDLVLPGSHDPSSGLPRLRGDTPSSPPVRPKASKRGSRTPAPSPTSPPGSPDAGRPGGRCASCGP